MSATPYTHQHSQHQEQSIMNFQDTPKITFFNLDDCLLLTHSASHRNTAKSTSYHLTLLAWHFIFCATLIQTSWLHGSHCLSETFLCQEKNYKQEIPVCYIDIFWHIKVGHN